MIVEAVCEGDGSTKTAPLLPVASGSVMPVLLIRITPPMVSGYVPGAAAGEMLILQVYKIDPFGMASRNV